VEQPQAPILNYREAKNRAVAEFESIFLSRLFDQANGNVSAAARLSGTERRHLGRLLKKYGITRV
jgi:DNA-binding NtrC family response regulator